MPVGWATVVSNGEEDDGARIHLARAAVNKCGLVGRRVIGFELRKPLGGSVMLPLRAPAPPPAAAAACPDACWYA